MKDFVKGNGSAPNLDDNIFGSCDSSVVLPRNRIPEKESSSKAILEIVKDELFLDGNARQNLATFCQTYEDEALHEIMDISINKNMIDKDEYPQSAEIEKRCVSMLGNLWNCPDGKDAIGTSTVGSSEACMLGGMAMYHRWREKRKTLGKSCDKPNLVTGPVQVCWEKFAVYWDIELRQVPMEEDAFYMTPENMLKYIDENTIGVVTTLGLTFTGEYEPVEELCKALDNYEAATGQSIDVHIDGASGAFVAPFCSPELLWDFRLPRVKSISASGHKFGLAPLGVGWVLWREKKDLPSHLVFNVNYLGGNMDVFQLNFSRPAGQVISQYYQFLRLGMEGYRKIHENCYITARYIAKEISKFDCFEVVYGGDEKKGIPAVTWKIKDGVNPGFNLYDFADKLTTKGWLVPAYSLPANATQVVVQRVLVRQGFGLDMASLFIRDTKMVMNFFETHKIGCNMTAEDVSCFNHCK